jgi:hypothetical protein
MAVGARQVKTGDVALRVCGALLWPKEGAAARRAQESLGRVKHMGRLAPHMVACSWVVSKCRRELCACVSVFPRVLARARVRVCGLCP